MQTIGTAGHVDHGKSALVQRLTDIDPDRLKEEKQRQLTIDLGFAWFDLNGETVGVVDVPGHRDFIENMLAGVGGIDAVLFVVAADEGVMPQTREHLAIIDLLGVERGLIALTKADLAPDDDWLDLVEMDVRETMSGTALHAADVVRVSAKTGDGIPLLLDKLSVLLETAPRRRDTNQPTLPIDRVFTVGGFGTVVTGTLSGGGLHIGDEVELQPGGVRGRVRGLQSYEQRREIAQPGSRTAVNIAGVEREAVKRGQVLAYPGTLRPTQLIDVQYRHLPDAPRPLKHNDEMKAFIGAAQAMATVRLLDADALPPGETGWLQLRLSAPLAVPPKSRFILRDPAMRVTVGGGGVVNANPPERYKRFRADVIRRLEQQLKGTPAERVVLAAEGRELVTLDDLEERTGLSGDDLAGAVTDAVQGEQLAAFDENAYLAATSYQQMQAQLASITAAYHDAYPLRVGIPREELREKARLDDDLFSLLLRYSDAIIVSRDGGRLRLTSHTVTFTDAQARKIDALFAAMNAEPFAPPSAKDAVAILGNDDLLRALVDMGDLVQAAPDVIFTADAYGQMVQTVREMFAAGEEVTAKTVRDQVGTSRKYAIALLEHLDSVGVTRRVGDRRVLKS